MRSACLSTARRSGRLDPSICGICVEIQISRPRSRPGEWRQIASDRFNVQTDIFDTANNFLSDGYAGQDTEAYVFGGGVTLNGNCPFKNSAEPTHSVKYRFLAAEWGYTAPGPRPGVMPSISPLPSPAEPNATWKVVTASGPTWVGDVYYPDPGSPIFPRKMSVYASPDPNGWIALGVTPINVPLTAGGTTNVMPSDDPVMGNWVRSGLLLNMDTVPLTGVPTPPAWTANRANAGRSLTDAEKVIIRRFSVVFQVRDVVSGIDIATEVRDSIIFDNSTPVGIVNIEQLLSNACSPILGLSSINIRYTVDHPHLRYFHMRIKSNATDPVHSEASLPGGDFTAGSVFFRGGASGPADPPNQTGGVAVNIAGPPPDPACAYAFKVRYSTRHYLTGEGGDEVLYCIE